MHDRRSVEHYRDHELICEAAPAAGGWYFELSVVTHRLQGQSEACTERSEAIYRTDLEALHSARERGHELIDSLIIREAG